MNEEEKLQFFKYLENYLRKRDITSTLKLLSLTMSSFGAGFDEKCYNYNSSSKLYERDIKEVPKPIDYKIKKLYLNKPVNKVFIVCCDLDMEISLKLFSQDKPSKTKYGFGKT